MDNQNAENSDSEVEWSDDDKVFSRKVPLQHDGNPAAMQSNEKQKDRVIEKPEAVTIVGVSCNTETSTTNTADHTTVANPYDAIQVSAIVGVSCNTETSTTKAADHTTVANPNDAIQGSAIVGVSCNTETSTTQAADHTTVANSYDAIQGSAIVGVSCNTETSTTKAANQSLEVIHDNAIQVISLSNGIDTTQVVADPKDARKEEILDTTNIGDNSVLLIYPMQKYAQVS